MATTQSNILSRDQQDVHKVIEHWTRSVQTGDLNGILANHADDIQMFDVNGPLEWRGLAAYRQTWEYFFKFGEPSDDIFVIENLAITAGSDVAFASGLLRIGGSKEPICRLTLGLSKVDDKWLIIHEHHSSSSPLEQTPE